MNLTPPEAYASMALAKRALIVPELQDALKSKELSVGKAGRILSVITK